MSLTVLKPGLLSSVQDTGRRARALGVPGGGAADPAALRLANALVGNPANAAALEITLLGPTLRFETAADVTLCGAPFAAHLDGEPFPLWRAVSVAAGSVLHIGSAARGARAVLAVRGGLAASSLFGSVAAERRAGFGGHNGDGQPLKAGDTLRWHELPPIQLTRAFISPELWPRLGEIRTLRVSITPEGEQMPESVAALLTQTFKISKQADRMGLRLNESVPAPHQPSRPSLPNVPGAVQLPPGGQPIILLPDAGTHGGYPSPLIVIRADQAALGQLRPGDSLRFEAVTLGAAVEALRRQAEALRGVEAALRLLSSS
ncbi:biotin-dependent carboxyltransferase family protein [Deinococcus sp.]|uniref:5-oxoprolinase subunit C family protein n=1 Tax=Deinococcus sp. TaxID=47478 RepID=UPI003B59C37B